MLSTIFNDLNYLAHEMNKVFTTNPYKKSNWPEIDVYNYEGEYIVKANVPGLKKEEIDIKFKDETLSLSGKREKKEGTKQYLNERFSGDFERKIWIDDKIDADQISANLDNGVLVVKLPKSPEAQPKSISIN